MRYLFFFVHPSKFYVFRETINSLRRKGHHVEILIISKDILEVLVKKENWDYFNLFPKGRKIKYLPTYVSSFINFVRTLIKLYNYTKKKSYSLFITDDLLSFIGKIRNIPTIAFLDDDIDVVKQFSFILEYANYCLAPNITNLGKYENIKIPFDSYKELAYLHPNYFKPDAKIIRSFNREGGKYFLIRLVSMKSYHDVGKKGLSDKMLLELISLLEKYGKVFISSERPLPEKLNKYKIKINPLNMAHVLYFSEMFVGDSQTMSSEASLLGVPTYRINDFVGKISVMEEKEKYGIIFNYKVNEFNLLLKDIKNDLDSPNFKKDFKSRIDNVLKEKIDLSAFMIWLFENFPNSINHLRHNNKYQYNFKKE